MPAPDCFRLFKLPRRDGKPLGPTPNNNEGYGRLNLARSLPLNSTGEQWSMNVSMGCILVKHLVVVNNRLVVVT
jgi:hypothetical protein